MDGCYDLNCSVLYDFCCVRVLTCLVRRFYLVQLGVLTYIGTTLVWKLWQDALTFIREFYLLWLKELKNIHLNNLTYTWVFWSALAEGSKLYLERSSYQCTLPRGFDQYMSFRNCSVLRFWPISEFSALCEHQSDHQYLSIMTYIWVWGVYPELLDVMIHAWVLWPALSGGSPWSREWHREAALLIPRHTSGVNGSVWC